MLKVLLDYYYINDFHLRVRDSKHRTFVTCILDKIGSYKEKYTCQAKKPKEQSARSGYIQSLHMLDMVLQLEPSRIGFDKENKYGHEYIELAKRCSLDSKIIKSLVQKSENAKAQDSENLSLSPNKRKRLS